MTTRRKKKNKEAKDKDGEVTFDPSIAREGDLSSYFQIFMKAGTICHNPALRPIQPANIIRSWTLVHTEGDRHIDEIGNISAGSGIWYGPNDGRNTYLKLRTDTNSNKLGELVAILWAITEEPPQNELTITTMSVYALEGILDSPQRWEPTRYIGVPNKDVFKSILAALRGRGGITRFRKLTGETTNVGYGGAKSLAKQGAAKLVYDEPDLGIHPNFDLTGAQLVTLTQSLAYRGICELKAWGARRGTAKILAITRHAIRDKTGTYPDDCQVWKSTRHQDFSKVFRTFVWKSIHATHQIGNYWDNIDNFSHRAKCEKCQVTKTLEHIILQCDIPGQQIVWKNVKDLWLKKHENWPELTSIGLITGCGLMEFKDIGGKVLKGVGWAYRILVSESAHFIWKLRCMRIHADKPECEWPKDAEIQHRWLSTINTQLALDRSSTSRKYGKKAVKQEIVLSTWERLLKEEENLPKNWLKSPGVLVGINQMEHQDGIPDDPP